MKRWHDSFSFAALLSLLLPGLGHIYRRDPLFGVFVFLVALLAGVLVFFSLLFPLPLAVKLVLFTLPAIFYLSSFFDLYRTVQKQGPNSRRSLRAAAIFVVLALVVQFLTPVAPGCFAFANRPSLGKAGDNDLAPLLRRGELFLTVEAAYRMRVPYWDKSIWLAPPGPGETVRFVDDENRRRVGLALARSGEYAEVVDGSLWVNGEPLTDAFDGRLRVRGDMSLTAAEPGSILVATLKLGAVDSTFQVPADRLLGRVYGLF